MPITTDIAKPAIGIITNNLAVMLTFNGDGPDLPVEAVIDRPGGGVLQ